MNTRYLTDDEMVAVERAAFYATTLDSIVLLRRQRIAVVPDVVLIEGIANGHPVEGTPLTLANGRTVVLYVLPEEWTP